MAYHPVDSKARLQTHFWNLGGFTGTCLTTNNSYRVIFYRLYYFFTVLYDR